MHDKLLSVCGDRDSVRDRHVNLSILHGLVGGKDSTVATDDDTNTRERDELLTVELWLQVRGGGRGWWVKKLATLTLTRDNHSCFGT